MPLRSHSHSPGPASPPALGHTPSLKYQPQSKADRKQDEKLVEMIRYRERTGRPHPDLPTAQTGVRAMTAEEAAATRLFHERYHKAARDANEQGTRFDFDRHEYCQTYRREGEDIVANQPSLIVGGFNFVAPQSGRFPPGTRVDIHSHPNVNSAANAMPSDLDQRVAHQLRTNALHRPGTRLDGAIMFFPPNDTFYGYTGEFEGPGKKLVFRELIDPYPMGYLGQPTLRRDRLRIPAPSEGRYKAYRPPREESRARETGRPDRLEVAPWEEEARGRPASARLDAPGRPMEQRPASLGALPGQARREEQPASEQPIRYASAPLAQPKPRRPGDHRPGLPPFALPQSPGPDTPARAREVLPPSNLHVPDPAGVPDPWDLGGLRRNLP